MSLNFKDYFSLEQYTSFYQLFMDKEDTEKKYKSPKKEFYDKLLLLDNLAVEMFSSLNKKSLLKPIVNGEHSTSFGFVWNKMLNNEELKDYEKDEIAYVHKRMLSSSLSGIEFKNITVEEAYEDFIKLMNQGNFEWFDYSKDNTCSKCSQKLQLEFKGWNPKFIVWDTEIKSTKTPESCFIDSVVEIDIEFKTNKLLIADWFRIDEFTEQVGYNKDYNDVSINYNKGRINSTKHSVNNFGFITVHVGNTCPHIFQNKNDFIFGHENYDEKTSTDITPYEDKGSVCTDLWNVTIIEKEQLIKIVSNKVGVEKAKEIVEEYLLENDYEEIEIESGNYKLCFCGDNEEFTKMANDSNIPKDLNAFFTLKKV